MRRALLLTLGLSSLLFLNQPHAFSQCDGPPYIVQCDSGDGTSCSTGIRVTDDVETGFFSNVTEVDCCGVPVFTVSGQYQQCYSAELKSPEASRNLLALVSYGDVFVPDCKGIFGRYLTPIASRAVKPPPKRDFIKSFEIPIKFSFPATGL